MNDARYALYYTPQTDSVLGRFGASWLGLDDERMTILGLSSERQSEITKTPRHYGFHATLKPPFHPVKGVGFEVLDDAVREFCEHHSAFDVPALKLCVLDGFLALRPAENCPKLSSFAAHCVRAFHHFRRPTTEQDLSKRLNANLSERQKEHLMIWGYPYIFEDFRFHMTLTERLGVEEQERVLKGLRLKSKPVLDCKPWRFDNICLVKQKNREADFQMVKRYALTASSTVAKPVKILKLSL